MDSGRVVLFRHRRYFVGVATRLDLEILPQPDETTCGPTCLHAVYRYYGEDVDLGKIISEVRTLDGGGTLGVYLGTHALERGYQSRILTYNLQVFDPTWFAAGTQGIAAGLKRQYAVRRDRKLRAATEAYLEFLSLGGRIELEDLTPALLRRVLTGGTPILTGLSATFLYRSARERDDEPDDAGGAPVGHFVVLRGYDRESKKISVADPLGGTETGGHHYYDVELSRLLNSILLGIVTYDANLLLVSPSRVGN